MYRNPCLLALTHMPDAEMWYETTVAVDPGPVRLHFAETEDVDPGARVFAVALQDRTVINELDLVEQTV